MNIKIETLTFPYGNSNNNLKNFAMEINVTSGFTAIVLILDTDLRVRSAHMGQKVIGSFYDEWLKNYTYFCEK